MTPTIEPVVTEILRLHHLHHRPIEIKIGADHTAISVSPPQTRLFILHRQSPRGAKMVYAAVQQFIGPPGMNATYVNNTSGNPIVEVLATTDHNALTEHIHHGEFTAHQVGTPPQPCSRHHP